MTERLHFHFSLSRIGEGNGNPLQCSCLENPRDGEAWCAAVYGVAQSRTRLKQLSSSSLSLWETWSVPSYTPFPLAPCAIISRIIDRGLYSVFKCTKAGRCLKESFKKPSRNCYHSFISFFFLYIIYFWLHWVFLEAQQLSS